MNPLSTREVSNLPFIFHQERESIEANEPGAREGRLTALDRNTARWIKRLPHTLFCVDADRQPLGSAMWILDGGTATLVSIRVLGSHRRQGLGRLLLDAFDQPVSLTGARVVELGVHGLNQARLLYETAG